MSIFDLLIIFSGGYLLIFLVYSFSNLESRHTSIYRDLIKKGFLFLLDIIYWIFYYNYLIFYYFSLI